MRTIVAGTALAVLLLAEAGGAQLTEQQANKAVKAACKEKRKQHAQMVQAHTGQVLDAIDAFSGSAPENPATAAADLFAALELYQQNLYYDFTSVHIAMLIGVKDALDEFAQGTPLAGVYPEEFYFGTRGALDDAREAMQATQAKSLAKVRKKLDKAMAKLAKSSNARLTAHLEPVTQQGEVTFIQGSILGSSKLPLVIHTVLALGYSGEPEGGMIMVGGFGDAAEELTVRATGEPSPIHTATAEFPVKGAPFWHVTFDDSETDLPDGNYVVDAEQGAVGMSMRGYVGIE